MIPERYDTFAKAFVSANDPTSTMDFNGRLVYSAESGDLFIFIADSDYGSGSWVNLGSGGGGAFPPTNWTIDGDGNFTLDAQLIVNTTDAAIRINQLGAGDVEISAEGDDGIVIRSTGSGPAVLDATQGTGYAAIQGSNGINIDSNSTDDDILISSVGDNIGGGGIKAISLVTAGGLKMNGTPGISGIGATMTNVTVVNGIITAATFA